MTGDTGGKTGTITGYLNGIQFGVVNGVGRLFAHPGDVAIGAFRNNTRFDNGSGTEVGNGDNFNGIIDEVALYNTALSAATISSHFSEAYGVLTNDTDPESNPLTAVLVANPTNGSLTLNADGSFVYTPDPNFDGTDTFTYRANDGTQNGNIATVTIDVVGAPDDPTVNDQSFGVDENSINGTVVNTIVATDPDTGDTLTYTVTGGSGAAVFAVDINTGQITVTDSSQLDFETTTSFTLDVTVTDSTFRTDTATITVNVNDLNENPTATDAAVASDENTPNSTSVHTVVATDPDAGANGTLSYAITAGNGLGGFTINAGTGEITVADFTMLDFETTPIFILTVTVTDGGAPGLTDTATITVNLNDINENPSATDATVALDENSPNLTSVHTVVATDPDAGANGTLSFAITAGNGLGGFTINGGTGEITVADSSVLDFETTPVFTLTVTVTDGGTPGLTDTATITINLNDLSEPVSGGSELRANSTTAGKQERSDITIDSNGNSIVVWQSDGQDGDKKGVYFQRFDVNENPLGSETLVNVTTIGDQKEPSVAVDANGNFVVVWSGNGLGDDKGVFARRYDATGTALGTEFRVNSTIANDEKKADVAVDVDGDFVVVWEGQDSDKKGAFFQRFDSSGGALGSETLVNTTTTDDQKEPAIAIDATGNYVVAWNKNGPGDTDGVFAQEFTSTGIPIGSEFGVNITVTGKQQRTSIAMNSAGAYAVAWEGEGPGDTDGVYLRLFIPTNPNIVDAATALDENSPNGTAVFDVNDAVTGNDTDADGDALTYSITAGNGLGGFAINGANGQITVLDTAVLDFETTPVFVLTVQASDGTNTDTGDITVNLNNLNDNNRNIVDAATALDENSANGTPVFDVNDAGTGNDTDADGDALTYTITAGNGLGGFAINGANGQITVLDTAVLDFETTPVFTLTVQASDGTNTDTGDITVNLNNLNEAPSANDATVSLDENSAVATVVHTVVAADPDSGINGTLSYVITGGNSLGAFVIDGGTGQIIVANTGVLDFETNPVFSLTVTVTDGGAPGLADTATITINLNDLNEISIPADDGDPDDDPPPVDPPVEDPIEPPVDPPPGDDDPPPPFEDGDTTEPPGLDPIPPATEPPPTPEPGEVGDKPVETPDKSPDENTTLDPIVETATPNDETNGEKTQTEVIGAISEIEKAFLTDALFQQLDAFGDDFNGSANRAIGTGLAASLTAALTAGYVVWTIRGGYLLSSLLASMPAWTMIDPLPVLNAGAGPDDKEKRNRNKNQGDDENQTSNKTLDAFLE